MPKLYDVVKAAGKYTDRDGNEKTRWINCGMIVKNQHGNLSLRLDVVPVGVPSDGDVGMWFALMEPKSSGGQKSGQPASDPRSHRKAVDPQDGPGSRAADDDDIPF